MYPTFVLAKERLCGIMVVMWVAEYLQSHCAAAIDGGDVLFYTVERRVQFNMNKWIFFDVGYTLIDETQMWVHRVSETRELAHQIGREVTDSEIMAKIMECATAYIPIAPTTARWLGLPDMAKYRGEFEELYDGADSVLADLKAKGYKLGVIANQPENLDGRLQKLGILKYFDVVVSSHDCGVVKPDEKIFRLALTRAQAAPEDCFMVGDRLDNDIAPAKKLGFNTVWVRQGICAGQQPRDDYSTPDYVAEGIAEVQKIFDKLANA